MKPAPILVLAPPESRRVRAFQATLQGLGLPPARVLSYADFITGKVHLGNSVEPGSIVRLESPGEDWATEKLILRLGETDDEEGEGYRRVDAAGLEYDHGRVWPSRQWYLGFRELMRRVKAQLKECPPHRLMNHPADILTMFDKRATHAVLQAAGVSVPPALPPVRSFDELWGRMGEAGWRRVFVKLAHGSSASGAVALETNGRDLQATSTVAMDDSSGELRLYNSKRLLRYRSPSEIRRLTDALCLHRVHVERWLPKAGWEGKVFDLRVVGIGGKARHVLVRLAGGPITNLHLGNARGDWEAVKGRIGENWPGVVATVEQALACFPGNLYAGVDVLLAPDYKRHAVLEMNAFGDYHRGVLVDGLDTYGAELEAVGFEVGDRGTAKGVAGVVGVPLQGGEA